jgi:hypothetical protein
VILLFRVKNFPPFPLSEECGRPDRALRLAGRVVRVAWQGTKGDRSRFFAALPRAVQLVGAELFGVNEILRLGLLRPGISPAQLRKVASRAAMTRVEEALNPAAWRMQVENKALFYRTCATLGLPAPRLLGIYYPDRVGWWQDGPAPADGGAWKELLRHECPEAFVIKPAVGAYGQGVSVFQREGKDGFLPALGGKLTLDELLSQLAAVGGRHGCVLQERAWNHPELERLSGSRYLQTARLITMLDRAGEPHLLHAHFKIIRGQNHIDNYHYGATGNFIARISLPEGTLEPGTAADPARRGLVTVERHPETGLDIAGFRLPYWKRACEFGLTLARRFAPLRLVGWDIALTPAGPVAVEGNWNSDPPNNTQCLDRILDDIRRFW